MKTLKRDIYIVITLLINRRLIEIGKDFKKELETIKKSHLWALEVPINNFVNAIKDVRNYSLIAIGSGGSLAVAQFASMLHQEYTGNISKYTTPLELALMRFPRNACFMLITAGGKNKDIIQALDILIDKEPKSIIILTANENSPLTELARKHNYIKIFIFPPPSKKDGFLATNSLYAFSTILARSYLELCGNSTSITNILPAFSIKIKNSSSKVFQTLNDIPAFLKDYTISVLYSDWAYPAASDLESKFSEAALGHVQIADYRNFGHGRHNWLDKRGNNTCVLILITPISNSLARKVLEIIPDGIPIITIETCYEGPEGTLSLILGVFEIVKKFGDLSGINPGRPRVAQFGRKLYHLGLKNCIPSSNDSFNRNKHTLWIERKISNDLLSKNEKSYLFEIAEKHLKQYFIKLTNTHFGGLILDYDGTLCELDHRFDNPPENIINEIIRLLNSDIIVGIATGRGKSVRTTLQPLIPRNRWKQVIIGYYNGGSIGDLSDDDKPDKNASLDPLLKEFEKGISNLDLFRDLKYERRPQQLTFEASKYFSLDFLYELFIDLKLKLGLKTIKITKSSHSLDVLAPNISKIKIIEEMRLYLGLDNNTLPVLSIGDKGKWPGNDFELLNNEFSLSVDECSSNLDSGWNIAPIGYKRTQATYYYLRNLKLKDNRYFILNLNFSGDLNNE